MPQLLGSALLVTATVSVAQARDFALKIETGLAFPVANPQSRIFDPGAGQEVKALFGLNRQWDAGPMAAFMVVPVSTTAGSGTAWALGGSVRRKRPRDLPGGVKNYGASPWLDLDAFYVRTGDNNRPGLAIGAGAAMAIGQARTFWVGPFVRYMHIFQFHSDTFEDSDAKAILFGVSLEIGSGAAHTATVEICPEVEVKDAAAAALAKAGAKAGAKAELDCDSCPQASYPDRDADSIPDTIDRCPDKVGLLENAGCPVEPVVVVAVPKLELPQSVLFATNKAKVDPDQESLLNAVAKALQEHPTIRVQIEGRSQGSGPELRNKTLAQKRAQAVSDYLVGQGIGKDRLTAKGLAAVVPSTKGPEATDVNRRVEFVMLGDGTASAAASGTAK